jgi:hypothetical protein
LVRALETAGKKWTMLRKLNWKVSFYKK